MVLDMNAPLDRTCLTSTLLKVSRESPWQGMNLVQKAQKNFLPIFILFKPTKTLRCYEVCSEICLPSPMKSPLMMRENQKSGKSPRLKTDLTIIFAKFQNKTNCHFHSKSPKLGTDLSLSWLN